MFFFSIFIFIYNRVIIDNSRLHILHIMLQLAIIRRIHDNTRHIRHKPCDVRLKVTALLFRLRTPHSIYLKEEYAAVVRKDLNGGILLLIL